MVVAVVVEFAVGLAALVLVPIGRPSGVLPHKGRLVYDAHAAVGVALLVGAVVLVAASRRFPRMLRIAAWTALAGVLVAGAGGLVAVDHRLRVLGIGLMFVGSLVAGFAYLVGVLEPPAKPSESEASANPG